ncbi:MAG: class I mannose-6-phosphate isomerase [Chloroflexi bacterium]|nr:class I mannose-6-phosphate isomerase [Chloroflexota bacterium]
MSELYPLFFSPVLKHYLWGGRNLEKLGRELPSDLQVAESWEIASHSDGRTVVSNGHYAGKNLAELLTLLGEDLVGSNNLWALERGVFPLLVKLLDAKTRLSIQVHPDDTYACEHEGGNELGKAEMWVILSATPGAGIIYGFSQETTPEVFRQAIQAETLDPLLNFLPVKAGDHVCVPPGTLHAILDGVLLAEIQQNSNTTYRVYDWGRLDNQGRARALHVDRALDVLNFQQVNEQLPISKTIEDSPQLLRETLCLNAYFVVERLTFKQAAKYQGFCDGTTMEIWGVIQGCAEIHRDKMARVKFCLLPAGLGEFTFQVKENSQLLRIYTKEAIQN